MGVSQHVDQERVDVFDLSCVCVKKQNPVLGGFKQSTVATFGYSQRFKRVGTECVDLVQEWALHWGIPLRHALQILKATVEIRGISIAPHNLRIGCKLVLRVQLATTHALVTDCCRVI